MTEKTNENIWVGLQPFMSVMMYVSYIPQIMNNLLVKKGILSNQQ